MSRSRERFFKPHPVYRVNRDKLHCDNTIREREAQRAVEGAPVFPSPITLPDTVRSQSERQLPEFIPHSLPRESFATTSVGDVLIEAQQQKIASEQNRLMIILERGQKDMIADVRYYLASPTIIPVITGHSLEYHQHIRGTKRR